MSYEYKYVRLKTNILSVPYSTDATFIQKNGTNEVTGEPVKDVSDDPEFNGYFINFDSAGGDVPTFFLPTDTLGQSAQKKYTFAFWFKPRQIDGETTFVLFSDGAYSQRYAGAIFRFSSTEIFAEVAYGDLGFSRINFNPSAIVVNEWNCVILSNTGDYGDVYLNGETPTSVATQANGTINRTNVNTRIDFFNSSGGECLTWGVNIWDGADVYSDVVANYPLQPPEFIEFPDGTFGSEFIIAEEQPDRGYGADTRKIFNKGINFNNISYSTDSSGLTQVQNTKISFSNVDLFYYQMQELNGDDFWETLRADFFWASGKVTGLIYDGSNWKRDGETAVLFTPDEPYSLIDSIKKEFSGYTVDSKVSGENVTLSFVSQEKQDSYEVGTIQAIDGADASKSLISPILIGNLTDENAYVPLVLKNTLNNVPNGICSDLDLDQAPVAYIYDDENERFHEVVNDQESINNNREIAFYDASLAIPVSTDEDYFSLTKEDERKILALESGEVVSYFSDTKDYFLISDYSDPTEYVTSDDSNRKRSEGSRNYDNLTQNDDTTSQNGFYIDEELAIGKAKIKLSLYPIDLSLGELSDGAQNLIDSRLSTFFFEKPDFTAPLASSSVDAVCIGRYKSLLDYRVDGPTYPQAEATFENNPSSLFIAPFAGDPPNIQEPDWDYYNYLVYGVETLRFDFEGFKYDGAVTSSTFKFYGGMYKYFNFSTDLDAFPIPSGTLNSQINFGYTVESSGAVFEGLVQGDSSLIANEEIDSSTPMAIDTVEGLKNSKPFLTIAGYGAFNPVKTTGDVNADPVPSECFTDYADPSYFGRTRYAIQGARLDVDISAEVESKYWCFKGRTSEKETLLSGLNKISSRYRNESFEINGTDRNAWYVSGVHFGNPIYYRDLIALISSEFRVFIDDLNGESTITPMEPPTSIQYTIDESNLFSPIQNNISYGTTKTTEIYNKLVIRYAPNHMIDRYAKTIEITKDNINTSTNIDADSTFNNLTQDVQTALTVGDSFLGKINISEKVKTVNLDWVRDDNTAMRIARWWAENHTRKRAIVSATVSKRVFLNAKIGDGVQLDLPNLPLFYNKNYIISKVVNGADNTYKIELMEFA